MTNLPEVKKYHLILVPVEGVHGGYVRDEDYRNLKSIARVTEMRLAESANQVCRLRGELEATLRQLYSKDDDLLQVTRRLIQAERSSTTWLKVLAFTFLIIAGGLWWSI